MVVWADMNDFVWQDAWVLLAVKYAQGDEGHAAREDVLQAGEFINHAHFLDHELEHALNVLAEADLLHVEGDAFHLGPAFPALWSKSGAETRRRVDKQLERLQEALGVTS